MIFRTGRILLLGVLAISATSFAQPDIQVQGLFAGKAVLNINGKMHMLSEGQSSSDGVTLESATTESAVISYDGKQFELTLSSRISSTFSQAEVKDVRLMPDDNGHYITRARINGRSVQVMLDTGATSVAMSSQQADALGINYQTAPEGRVSTASGVVSSRQVTLSSVEVGAIALNSVNAIIIEGDSPDIILLGNSFLSRVAMRNEGSLMVLTAPF